MERDRDAHTLKDTKREFSESPRVAGGRDQSTIDSRERQTETGETDRDG
jgi:hypothetical protein